MDTLTPLCSSGVRPTHLLGFRPPLRPRRSSHRQAAAAGRRRRATEAQGASWDTLAAYAADQRGEVAAGRGPRRPQEIEERYQRYFQWSASRGVAGAEYLVLSAQWRSVHNGPWVALEPNIVPYDVESGIEHWTIWYHPRTTAGTADLDVQVGAVVELFSDAAGSGRSTLQRGRIWALVGSGEDTTYEVAADGTGERYKVKRTELRPCGYDAVLQHIRVFLPALGEEEVVIFQNVPERRSVPEVAHAHVFIRPSRPGNYEELQRLRREWQLRSPWAEHERLTGRAAEVGFGP